jgi:two-component system OmpR family response regulator
MAKLVRILSVEDEPDIRAVTELALGLVGGFEVKLCGSGEEAIIMVDAFGPDLLLLDVMMPVMDGPTTLKRLRERPASANIPAIFMTAKVQPKEVDEYKALGAIGVIAKPFDPMALANQIREIWREHHGE